jgi:peptidoglycan/xylan/chitin deacetylase (PgdA/CDA1 family)
LTNDDAGSQEPALFRELLDFLAAQRVPATFFVVPNAGGVPLDEKSEWLDLLRRALDEGHELELHGFEHGVFEFGVPPGFMLDIIPEAKARLKREPEAVRAPHTRAALGEKIARGLEILNRALGVRPQGFRSGCLATCDEMYAALADNRLRWSSNRVVNPIGWRYIAGNYDAGEPWQPDVPPRPHPYTAGLIEVPMHSEYTWLLGPDDLERQFDLLWRDYERVRATSGVFVALSHYYAMTGPYATGLRVYERAFARARALGNVRFCTIRQLLAQSSEAARPGDRPEQSIEEDRNA